MANTTKSYSKMNKVFLYVLASVSLFMFLSIIYATANITATERTFEISQLPHLLAIINGLTVIMLLIGYAYIRNGDIVRHRASMKTCIVLAVLFLIIYVFYHLNAGLARFGGEGIVRPIYFTILIVHVIGAVALVVMVPMTFVRALRERFDAHKRLARWTWPLWLYVSVSGVVVYVMAIHLYPYSG